MNIELKPHLREIEDLYKKVNGFESAVNLKYTYSPVESAYHYIKEDGNTVIDALSAALDFNAGALGDLKEALLSGKTDFTRLISAGDTIEEEEYRLLYIVSRPFFRSMRDTVNMDGIFWQDGRCPVCSAVPALSVIEKESQRKYFCSFCGTPGYFNRIGCPACLTEDPRNITIISLEGEEGMRADTCEKCGSYVKTFEGSLTEGRSMDSLDIMSVALDIIVQEKGFKRNAPNPVGMMKMG